MSFINDILLRLNKDKVREFDEFYKINKDQVDEFCKGTDAYNTSEIILSPSFKVEIERFRSIYATWCDKLFKNTKGSWSYRQINAILKKKAYILELYNQYSTDKSLTDELNKIKRNFPMAYEEFRLQNKLQYHLSYEELKKVLKFNFKEFDIELRFQKEILENKKRKSYYLEYFGLIGKEKDKHYIINHLDEFDIELAFINYIKMSPVMNHFLSDFLTIRDIKETDIKTIVDHKDDLYHYARKQIEIKFDELCPEINYALKTFNKIFKTRNLFAEEEYNLTLPEIIPQEAIDSMLKEFPDFEGWLFKEGLERRGDTIIYKGNYLFRPCQHFDGYSTSLNKIKDIYFKEKQKRLKRQQKIKDTLKDREEKIKEENKRVNYINNLNQEFSKKFILITHPKFRKHLAWIERQNEFANNLSFFSYISKFFSSEGTNKNFKGYNCCKLQIVNKHFNNELDNYLDIEGLSLLDNTNALDVNQCYFVPEKQDTKLLAIGNIYYNAYCYAHLDYTECPWIKENAIDNELIKKGLKKNPLDIQSVIDEIEKFNNNSDKLIVLFGRNKDEQESLSVINEYSKIKNILASKSISCYNIDEDINQDIKSDRTTFLIIEGFTNDDNIIYWTNVLIKKYFEKYPLICWLSFRKEYSEKQMRYILDIPQKENQRKQRIEKCRELIIKNKDGVKHIFPDIDFINIKWDDYEKILLKECEITRYQSTLENLRLKVKDWEKLGDTPYYYFYNFYPSRFNEISKFSKEIRREIFNFKNGGLTKFHKTISQKLSEIFTQSELSSLTFVGVPASSRKAHEDRYQFFCVRISERTGMVNSYKFIKVRGAKDSKHLRDLSCNYDYVDEYSVEFDKDFFLDKFVILFDDIVTTGDTLLETKKLLENVGAKIICAISLGRTANENYQRPHPYNGVI